MYEAIIEVVLVDAPLVASGIVEIAAGIAAVVTIVRGVLWLIHALRG